MSNRMTRERVQQLSLDELHHLVESLQLDLSRKERKLSNLTADIGRQHGALRAVFGELRKRSRDEAGAFHDLHSS